MDNTADVLVIGAGHNALTTAAYLVRAGLSVIVLEGRPMVGGGTVTEELVPGSHHDTFSTGHPWLQTHPIFRADELGLFKHGLRYVGHDPMLVLPFPDGESLVLWRDKHRTAEGIARFSRRDAEAWLGIYDEWQRLAPVHVARSTTFPGDTAAPPADPAAEAEYRALVQKSCFETAFERFESEYVRGAALWFGMVVTQPIDQPGTGHLPLSGPVGWADYGWINAVGGSGRLAEALADAVTRGGGRVITGAPVVRILTEAGRASGVRTADGRTFTARRAVVSSAHFTSLPNLLGAPLPPRFEEGIQRWRSGPSLFVVYLSVPENPRARLRDGAIATVLSGQAIPDGIRAQLVNVVEGRLTLDRPWMFQACSTWIDPSRAAEGRGTVKLITFAPYALEGDPAKWEAVKADYADFLVEEYSRCVVGFRPGDELGRFVNTPADIERRNPSYHRGAPQSGEMLPDQMGLNRPVPGWGQYRMPVPGLYQTGTSTHPGGPVSGWPGRHAARAVLEDLQMDWRAVVPDTIREARPEIPVIDTSAF